MKKGWRNALIAIVVIGLLAAASPFVLRFLQPEAGVNAASNQALTETAAKGKLTATIGETGTVRARQTAVLTWQTAGTVEEVHVSVLDTIRKDQVLAELAYSSLSQAVIQAQSDLLNAQSQLNDLYENYEKDLAEAQLAVINAQEELEDLQKDRDWLNYPRCNQETIDDYLEEYQDALERVDDLEGRYAESPDNGMIRDALISARSTRDTAYANYNYCTSPREESEINEADTEIALAQAKLELAQQTYDALADGTPDEDEVTTLELRIEAAQSTLSMALMQAPFDGTVTTLDVLPGDQVNAGTIALRLDDLSELLVDVEISEIDINSIQVGQEVVFTFDAIPVAEYHGRVVEIATVGNAVQGVVEFKVTTSIEDADEMIRPGMTAVAEIVTQQLDDVLLVPNQSVRIVDGQRVVYVLKADGSAEEVAIELGAQSLYYSQVLDGALEPGDEIILNPADDMFEFGPGSGRGPGGGMF